MARADRWSNGRLTVGLFVTPLKKKKKKIPGYTLSMFCDNVGYLQDLVMHTIDFGHEPAVVRERVPSDDAKYPLYTLDCRLLVEKTLTYLFEAQAHH